MNERAASRLVLGGRYRLGRLIASGGMGSVHEARDERLGRRVAVKVLRAELADDPSFVERFRREAHAAASLSHPSIATVFDYGEHEGIRFIVMELVDAANLAQVIRETGALDPSRAVAIATQICDALQHAHDSGIVHRDVKSANVLVGPEDRVKVTDFGIARAVGDASITRTGVTFGSSSYLSPEQAGGQPVTFRSDLYSAGIVLFEMLTGAVPFTAETPIAVAMKHINEDVPAPSNVRPSIPPSLDRVVAVATAKAPEDRYESAREMREAMAEVSVAGAAAPPDPGVQAPTSSLGGDSTDVLEPGATPVTERRAVVPRTGIGHARRRPWALAAIVGVVLAVVVVVAVLLGRTGSTPPPGPGGTPIPAPLEDALMDLEEAIQP